MRIPYILSGMMLVSMLLSGCQRPAQAGVPEPQLPAYPDDIPLRARGIDTLATSGGQGTNSASADSAQQVAAKPRSPEELGKQLFNQHGCASCHSNKQVAPPLEGLYGQAARALASGATVKADEAYLRESIINPTAKVAQGYPPIMPSYKHLPPDEVNALVAYIKNLK